MQRYKPLFGFTRVTKTLGGNQTPQRSLLKGMISLTKEFKYYKGIGSADFITEARQMIIEIERILNS